jgi:tripartite-type tricarboxylate transporter receptor subunit TctC
MPLNWRSEKLNCPHPIQSDSKIAQRESEFAETGFVRLLEILLASAILLASIGMLSSSRADQFPSRSIKIVVGFAPGGPADIPARAIASKLPGLLGVSVVVENRPGAGGLLATQDVLSRPRDGYSLLLCTYFDPVNTLLYRKAKYKVADIAPISLIATYDYAFAVPKALPAETVAQLIELTKSNPTKYNYGIIGIGSPANLIFRQVESLTGMKMTPVPFKGSAPAMQEVIAGRLDLYIVPPISAVQPFEAKQIKVLAVTGSKRLASLPDVPTLQESGIPVVAFAFLGVCAGAGTPQPVIAKLNDAVGKVVKSADYEGLITKLGSVPVSSTPAELKAAMDAVVRDAAPIVAKYKLQMD